jgi:5'-methylthioadenosine phosphorylase
MTVRVGIIGGSGLDDPTLFEKRETLSVETIYGPPSAELVRGRIRDREVVLLARHGKHHRISPGQVNYRANIQAFNDLGVTHILATTACGSLREEIGRGDFVIVDQFIDFTRHRQTTFFDSFANGARHTAMADPFDAGLRSALLNACRELGFRAHDGGTVITIEGPRFSTRAESNMFRSWGADVINMSVAPEAALANEAGIPYAAVAMSTDYDCWKRDEAPVSWQEILEVFQRNADRVQRVLIRAVGTIGSVTEHPGSGDRGK